MMKCTARTNSMRVQCDDEKGHYGLHGAIDYSASESGKAPAMRIMWSGPDRQLLAVDLDSFDASTEEFFRHAINAMIVDQVLAHPFFDGQLLREHILEILVDESLKEVDKNVLAGILAERVRISLGIDWGREGE